MQKEIESKGIPFEAQKPLDIYYHSKLLRQNFQPDFICYNKIILEIKAAKNTVPEHEAQILNYLEATEMKLGLLANFGAHTKATVKRYAH